MEEGALNSLESMSFKALMTILDEPLLDPEEIRLLVSL